MKYRKYTQNLRTLPNIIPKNLLLFPVFLGILIGIVTILTFRSSKSNTPIEANTSSIEIDKIADLYKIYQFEQTIDLKLSEMTIEEKISQLFMVSVSGSSMNENVKKIVENYHIGGIVIMSANIASKQELIKFITDIQNLADTPLFIATDQEGKGVNRIPWDASYDISQPHIGIVNREDFAYETGKTHANALKDIKLNINLAPVLDIAFEEDSIMAGRSLGSDPEKVANLGKEIIRAHQDIGILATAKHFPGIGRTTIDSHQKLPVIDISKEQLLEEELIPFRISISQKVDIIMTGHVLYPQIDPDYPASLSKIITSDLLRDELGFEGIIITDDIRMKALSNYPNKAVESINAGTDMILVVDSFENQVNYIDEIRKAFENDTISGERIEESVRRVLRVKYTL